MNRLPDLRPSLIDVMVFDSHVKAGTFANWIADHHQRPLKRIEFSALSEADDHLVDYVDLIDGNGMRRIVVCTVSAMAQPLMRPLIYGAASGVLVLNNRESSHLLGCWKAFVAHAEVFKADAVICLVTQGRESLPEEHLPGWPGGQSINRRADVDPGDCAQLWTLMRKGAPKTTSPALRAPAAHGSSIPLYPPKGAQDVANVKEVLSELLKIDGALGGFIADFQSGMQLAKAGGGVDLDVAAAGNSEVIKAKMKTMAALGIKDSIEDILITLGTQYHIIRPVPEKMGLFLYLVLDREKSNLAMARFKVAEVEKLLAL